MASSDPNDLRKEAGKYYVDQVNIQSKVGIFDFGAGDSDSFEETRMLSDFTENKTQAKAALD